MSYSYDAASNRTGLTDPNNSPTSYTYDALNRPALIKDFNRNTFTFAYDALSRTTQLARSNRVNSNYQYDAVSNLLSVLHQNGTATLDGAVYSYDAAGNRSAKTNKLNGVASNFAYDNLYELLGVTQSGSTAESYTYDAVGNRLSSSAVPGYTYDVSNELQSAGPATYTYDANGNMLTRTNSSGTTNYAWDFENRLTSVTPPGGTSVTFKYDPQGRRIQKSGSVYLYDGANLIQESDSSGSLVARYIQGLSVDQPLAAYRGSASEFYETDGLGSISSLTTTSGTVNQSYVFDSFGNTSSTTGTFTQPFRFTGREFDGETGLYYYRARYYDPIVGRFMSEDPIGFDGGSTNFYSYVLNNPIRFKDPSGNLISVNGTKQDNIDYATARLYLIQDSVMADIFYNLQRSHTTYIIHILTGDNCNNHSIDNHIYWNPHCGLRCTGTGRQSPALALGHELDHASHPRKNLWFDFSDYDNQEERRVIEGSESHAAHTLGEGIRHDHRGESVPGLASPTTIPLPRNYI